MRFTFNYLILTIAAVLVAPVVYSLAIKTEPTSNDLRTVKDSAVFQACRDLCSPDIIRDLTEQYRNYGLNETDCANPDGYTVNETSPCVNSTEAFEQEAIKILDAGEECRRQCLEDNGIKASLIRDYKSCLDSERDKSLEYAEDCWSAAEATAIFNQLLAVACGEAHLHRYWKVKPRCCEIGCSEAEIDPAVRERCGCPNVAPS